MKKSAIVFIVLTILLVTFALFALQRPAREKSLEADDVDAYVRQVLVSRITLEDLKSKIAQEKRSIRYHGEDYSIYLNKVASLRKVRIEVNFFNRSKMDISNLLRFRMTPKLKKMALFVDQLGNITPYHSTLVFDFLIDTSEMPLGELKEQMQASELIAYWGKGHRDLDVEMGVWVIPDDEFVVGHKIIRKTISLKDAHFYEEI